MSSGEFEGPCTGQTLFKIDGTLVASSSGPGLDDQWLVFKNIDGLTISGTGTFDGNGASTWSRCKRFRNCDNRPAVSNYK